MSNSMFLVLYLLGALVAAWAWWAFDSRMKRRHMRDAIQETNAAMARLGQRPPRRSPPAPVPPGINVNAPPDYPRPPAPVLVAAERTCTTPQACIWPRCSCDPSTQPASKPEALLDALFRENAIPMSDRNGRLYDAIRTALATRGQPK